MTENIETFFYCHGLIFFQKTKFITAYFTVMDFDKKKQKKSKKSMTENFILLPKFMMEDCFIFVFCCHGFSGKKPKKSMPENFLLSWIFFSEKSMTEKFLRIFTKKKSMTENS